MADLAVCKAPDGVTTLGLGSCVGIAIRDPVTKVGGLAHVMLPDSTAIKNNGSIEKFADTGIEELVRQMVAAGANRSRLEAKIAGGAQMFSFQKNCDLISVGDRNAEASKAKLKQMGPFIEVQGKGSINEIFNKIVVELEKILKQEEVITTETVHKIIKKNFGVDYSYKQVRIIVKSLGYSYSKPYPINIETDPQKVENFKKNSHNSI